MDLVAEMLLTSIESCSATDITASGIRPSFVRRFSRHDAGPDARTGRLGALGFKADRGLNRFWDYPRALRKLRGRFDAFHVVDHAYAHLVHALPAERTVVTCHDLHAFQSVLAPEKNPRALAFRRMTERVLNGLAKAARVVVDASPVRDDLVRFGIVPPERIEVVHLGVHPTFFAGAEAEADAAAERHLGAATGRVEILHVGGTFTRKRLDLVLRIFARVLAEVPTARLVRVGGRLTEEQRRLAEALGIGGNIVTLPFIGAEVLAAVYRRAALVILPSEEEGFGFPVLEGMASGSPVIASDLPVLREVGAEAAVYEPVGDLDAWTARVVGLLEERGDRPEEWAERREKGVRHARHFTWERYAQKMINIYQGVVSA